MNKSERSLALTGVMLFVGGCICAGTVADMWCYVAAEKGDVGVMALVTFFSAIALIGLCKSRSAGRGG